MEKENKKNYIIRDLRRKDKYSIDDEYLNGYAKLCGVFGTAVYNSLCRHASKDQECFPSVDLMAEQHGISRPSVLKGMKNLKEWGIVKIIKEKDTKTNRQKNNVYILMDRVLWKATPSKGDLLGAESTSDTEPSQSQNKSRVNDIDCKDTHIKDTHIRIVEANASDVTSFQEENAKCKFENCGKDPIKGKEFCKNHQPMNCAEFVAWYGKSEKRYIRIISEWADTVRPEWETVAQWEVWAGESYKAAAKLQVFSDAQMSAAFARLKGAKYLDTYNLTTLLKNLLNTNKK